LFQLEEPEPYDDDDPEPYELIPELILIEGAGAAEELALEPEP